jgi:hypothetical protein
MFEFRSDDSFLSSRGGIIGKVAARASADSRRSRLVQLLQLPATITLILCIEGGTSEASSTVTPSNLASRQTNDKWGIVIFVA